MENPSKFDYFRPTKFQMETPRAKVKIVDRKVDTKRSKYQVWSLTLPSKDPQWYAEY